MYDVSKEYKKFSEWLENELAKRDMRQADLARKSGLTTATISNVINNKRNAGAEVCSKIAIALNLPPEEVYRVAGLFPPNPKTDKIIEESDYLLNSYEHPETKARALEYLRFLKDQEDKGNYDVGPVRKPSKS